MMKPFGPKSFALLSIVCTLCVSGALAAPQDIDKVAPPPLPIKTQEDTNGSYAGKWLWAEGSDRFTLSLTEKDGKLSGFHTMMRDSGGRWDSVPTGPLPSISGDIHGTSTVVLFRSGQPGNESYGHARLTLRGRYLYWELVDTQSDSILPANAVLIRQAPGAAGGF